MSDSKGGGAARLLWMWWEGVQGRCC